TSGILPLHLTSSETFSALLRGVRPSPGAAMSAVAKPSNNSDSARQNHVAAAGDSRTPILSLAPMQDVTTLEFMRVMAQYGGPDVYWTEFFRVHGDSRPEKWILDSITKNPTGRPVIAQMIGNDIPALVRNAKLLQQYPVAAIDL